MQIQRIVLTSLAVVALAAITGWAQESDSKKEVKKPEFRPVAIEDGIVTINPENTRVEFIGTHVGDNPRPRLGGFKKFEGKIQVDPANNTVQSIEAEFDVTSIWTEFVNLTAHLKTADFFDVEKYATAKFKSAAIEKDDDGNTIVKGELTLHGVTSEIEFPVKYEIKYGRLILKSEFEIDRTQFGMDKMTSGVEPIVTIRVVVGQPNQPKKEQPGNGRTPSEPTEEKMAPQPQTVSVKLPHMI